MRSDTSGSITVNSSDRTNHSPSRGSGPGWRVTLIILAMVWTLITFPLVASGWSWSWVSDVAALPGYRDVILGLGHSVAYALFGALGALSFVLIGIASWSPLVRARWGGVTLALAILLTAPISVISYFTIDPAAPLHALSGAEAYALIGIGIAGILAAASAGRSWPTGMRVLFGCTLLVLAAGMLALAYFPHGPVFFLGVEAIIWVLGAPRE